MKKSSISLLGFGVLATVIIVFGFASWKGGSLGSLTRVPSGPQKLCEAHGFADDQCYQCRPDLAEKFKAALDWCHEHNLPESQCELCDPYAKFKARGDWCKPHGFPQSQCVACNPSLATKQPRFVDWCPEHEIAESQCTLCQPNLRVSTQSDWCQEHRVRDSECLLCHPELREKVVESGSEASPETPAETDRPSTGHGAGYCEHGFEKESCFQCHPNLEVAFKQKGDWCGGHQLPESQCVKCNPEIAAEVNKRLMVSAVRQDLVAGGAQGVKTANGTEGESFPPAAFCGTHLLRVKFSRPEIAGQIGLRIEPVRKRPLRETLEFTGEVLYNGSALARLSSRSGGTITEVRAEVGQEAQAGEVLVILENLELGEAKLQFLRAQEELELARENGARLARLAEHISGMVQTVQPEATAEELLIAWKQYEAGEARSTLTAALHRLRQSRAALSLAEKQQQQWLPLYEAARKMIAFLREGKATARESFEKLKDLEVGDPKAALLEKLAEVELARAEYDRQQKMKADQVAIEKDILAAKKAFESSLAAYGALLEQTSVSLEKERIEAEGRLEKARLEAASAQTEFETLAKEIAVDTDLKRRESTRALRQAENAARLCERQLALLGVSSEEMKSMDAQSSEDLARYALRAPFQGIVIERSAGKGEFLEAGRPILALADLSTLWLKLDVFERDLLRLERGAPVAFQLDGLSHPTFEGSLTWLGSEVNEKTRTVHVRAEVANPDGILRANMFGRATVLVREEEEAILIPKSAVQWEGCCHVVFVQLQEDLYAPRKIRIGYETQDSYEVTVGLLEGEPVVTQGSFLLKTEILKSSIGAGCTD